LGVCSAVWNLKRAVPALQKAARLSKCGHRKMIKNLLVDCLLPMTCFRRPKRVVLVGGPGDQRSLEGSVGFLEPSEGSGKRLGA
jgi:hypothetical protein